MRARAGTCCGLILLLGACARPSALLLPGEDGHPTGAVAVLGGKDGETVIDRPLTSARLSPGRPSLRTVASVKPAYQALLAALPPPAARFTLYFIEGTTRMTPESVPVIDRIRAAIATHPGAEVQVTGHTDTLGSEADNDALSKKRAAEIVQLLIAQGFQPDLLSAVGRGERDPVEQTGDGVASAANHRVEVVVR